MTIVLFIISLLILIVIPNLAKQKSGATKVHSRAMVNVIQTQADLYENETGRAPRTINELYQEHYLTAAQVKSAKKNNIKIQNGQVSRQWSARVLPLWS